MAEDIACLTRYAGRRMTRKDVTRLVKYMKKLEDKVNYCVEDGIMSDALSLRDANTHHEQMKRAMEEFAEQIGLHASEAYETSQYELLAIERRY